MNSGCLIYATTPLLTIINGHKKGAHNRIIYLIFLIYLDGG